LYIKMSSPTAEDVLETIKEMSYREFVKLESGMKEIHERKHNKHLENKLRRGLQEYDAEFYVGSVDYHSETNKYGTIETIIDVSAAYGEEHELYIAIHAYEVPDGVIDILIESAFGKLIIGENYATNREYERLHTPNIEGWTASDTKWYIGHVVSLSGKRSIRDAVVRGLESIGIVKGPLEEEIVIPSKQERVEREYMLFQRLATMKRGYGYDFDDVSVEYDVFRFFTNDITVEYHLVLYNGTTIDKYYL